MFVVMPLEQRPLMQSSTSNDEAVFGPGRRRHQRFGVNPPQPPVLRRASSCRAKWLTPCAVLALGKPSLGKASPSASNKRGRNSTKLRGSMISSRSL